jgi:hypothetical protein
MAQDVLITPASGLIEFYETAGNLEASIQLDNSNNLVITGNVTLGDAGADIIIGDGVSAANVIFEQGGAIYGLATKTLTLGLANSNISFAGTITSALNINPGVAITGINLNNNNLIGVNHIIINDPGPGEGLQWAGGSGWQIYESPNNLTTNSGGNLQIVTGSTRRATFNTSGQLDLPVAIGTAPLMVVSTTRVANLNVATAGVADTATTAGTVTTAAQPNITSVGTLSALSVTGNITGNYFVGNGSQLTGINSFSTIAVSGQSSVTADSIADTLTLAAGSGIEIVTNAGTDTITINSTDGASIFATGGNMGTVDEAVTAEEDLGLITDAITQSYDLGTIILGGLVWPTQLVLPSFTVAEIASLTATPAGQMILCTNEAGGTVPAFSDGTDWRRVTDRAVIT